jgi:cell division protein FtsX
LVNPYEILPYMVAIFLSIGLVIGSLGSIVSMRKFLNV